MQVCMFVQVCQESWNFVNPTTLCRVRYVTVLGSGVFFTGARYVIINEMTSPMAFKTEETLGKI